MSNIYNKPRTANQLTVELGSDRNEVWRSRAKKKNAALAIKVIDHNIKAPQAKRQTSVTKLTPEEVWIAP